MIVRTKLLRTKVPPREVKNKIIHGYVFTLVDTQKKTHVTYKTIMNKTHGDMEIMAKTQGNKYIQIGGIEIEKDKGSHLIVYASGQHDNPMFCLIQKFWNGLVKNDAAPNIVLWIPFRCLKCKRLLTDPHSIELGYGPACKKTCKTHNKTQSEFISH